VPAANPAIGVISVNSSMVFMCRANANDNLPPNSKRSADVERAGSLWS
jgi:hypothetical protein